MAMPLPEFREKFNTTPIEKPAAKRTFNIALGDRNADRLNSAAQGENWHINVRDLTASLVKKGVSDRVIQALAPSITLPGYDIKQTEDELRKFTTSAKEKGFGDEEHIPFENNPLDGFNLISIGDLSSKEFTPIDWLLEPFLPRPSLTLIAGSPKVGKSWLCLFFALQIASEENEVIYLANEDNERRLKDRINSICPFPPDGLHFIAGLSAEKVVPKGDAAHVLRALVSRRPATKCVIVDTLAAIRADISQKRTRDEYSLSEEEFSNLRKLAHELGITLILVHHTRKANENDAHPVERIWFSGNSRDC